MNKERVRAINIAMVAALQSVEAEYGVSIKTGSSRFGDDSYAVKVDVVENDASGNAVRKEAVNFKSDALFLGLPPGSLGQMFTFNGYKYTIVGANRKSYKRPILVSRTDNGKEYKMGADDVIKSLKRMAK
jgi:hypothetical protein